MNAGANETGAPQNAIVTSSGSGQPKPSRDEAPLYSEFDKDHGAEADQAKRIAEAEDE